MPPTKPGQYNFYEDLALLNRIQHAMIGLREVILTRLWTDESVVRCGRIPSKAPLLLNINVFTDHAIRGTGSTPMPTPLLHTNRPITVPNPVNDIPYNHPTSQNVSSFSNARPCIIRRSLERRSSIEPGGLIAGIIPAAICVALLFVIIIRHFMRRRQTKKDGDIGPQPEITEIIEKPSPPDLRVVTDQKDVYYERGDSSAGNSLRGLTPMYERYSMRPNDPPTVPVTPLPDSPTLLTSRPYRPLPKIPVPASVQSPKPRAIRHSSSMDAKTSPQTTQSQTTQSKNRMSIPLPEDGIVGKHPPTSFRDVGMHRSSGTLTPTTSGPKPNHLSRTSSISSQASNKTIQGLKKIIRFSNSTYTNEPALSDAASHTLGNLSRQTSMSSMMSHRKRRASIASSLGADSDGTGTFGSWYRVPHDAPALPALAFLKEDAPGSPLKTLME